MNPGAHPMPALEVLAARCRARGVKATPQRLEVYRALLATDSHPSPEAIYQVVKTRMPSVSLATIYKTLEALRAAGLARLVSHAGDTKRYDGRTDPHHHLVCRACGRIVDFVHPAFQDLSLPAPPGGFITDEVSVQLLGYCNSTCAQRQDQGKTKEHTDG